MPLLATGNLSVNGGWVVADVFPRNLSVGQSAKATRLGFAQVSPTGHFDLRADPADPVTAAVISDAVATNNGWVNFDVEAIGDDGSYSYTSVPRRWNGTSWEAESGDKTTDAVKMTMSKPNRARAFKALRSFDAAPATACVTIDQVMAEGDTNTTIGEFHTGDDQTGYFRYGKTADSSVEVGIQNPPGAPWGISGSVHIGNSSSSGTAVTWNEGAQFGYKLRTGMHYQKVHHWLMGCYIENIQVKGVRWNAGGYFGDNVHSLDNNCRNLPTGYRSSYPPRSDLDRFSEDFTWFTAAASAFGASLRAKSGASTWVAAHWHHGTSYPAYYHCGNDSSVPYAHRIYSGW